MCGFPPNFRRGTNRRYNLYWTNRTFVPPWHVEPSRGFPIPRDQVPSPLRPLRVRRESSEVTSGSGGIWGRRREGMWRRRLTPSGSGSSHVPVSSHFVRGPDPRQGTRPVTRLTLPGPPRPLTRGEGGAGLLRSNPESYKVEVSPIYPVSGRFLLSPP